MKNTILSRPASRTPSKRKSALRSSVQLETLEIRNLLAANTLAFVDNLSIDQEGATRDLQLDITTSTSTLIGVRIAGTSGDLDPDAAKIFNRDSVTGEITTQVTPYLSNKDVGGKTDSLVYFQVTGSQQFTVQVGGESGTGDFIAEVFLFGDATGDGGVSEHEYMRAVAAELQGRGAGNHNTALYFQTMWGIDFNKSQYNGAFDANFDGKIDGTELGMMQANYQATLANGGGSIIIDLVGDAEGPAVEAGVAVDTGAFDDDNITNVTQDQDGNAIVGVAIDGSGIESLFVYINNEVDNKIDLVAIPDAQINTLERSENEISFGFSILDLDNLLDSGTVVNSGPHTLTFMGTDALGNESTFEIVFEFDTIAPVVDSFILDPDSDTGISDSDGITNITTPTFIVEAEAGSKVEFYSGANLLGVGVESEGTPGLFTFTPETGFAEGSHTISIEVTDLAGNVTDGTPPVVIVIDTIDPAAPANFNLTNQTLNNHLTDDAFANITGVTDANAQVSILIDDDVVATVTANGSGVFTFENVPLELGQNDLVFVAEDLAGNTSQAAFSVTRNTEPSINDQNLSVDENSPVGTVVGTVVADSGDPGDTLTYEIVNATVNYEGAFVINSATGQITVADSSLLDFEEQPVITLTVRITDSLGDGQGGAGLVSEAVITIALNDVNEAPSIEDLTIVDVLANTTDPAFEHSPEGAVIGMIPISDPDVDDDDFTFNIISGNTGGAFEIVTVEVDGEYFGEIRVANPAALNFATNPTFELVVTVTDSGGPDGAGNELTSEPITLIIALRDVIQNQTLDPIAENPVGGVQETQVGDVVGQITSPSFDYSEYSFSIVGGNTGGAFAIDSNGVITVANADPSVLNFEVNPSFALQVEVTDAGAPSISPYTVTVTIGLLDRNDAPTVDQAALTALDVTTFEHIPDPASGFEVGLNVVVDLDDYFSDVDAGQTLTYSIVGGNTGNAFSINANNEIVINNPEALDFETTPQFTLTIRATDDGANPAPLSVDGTLVINLQNLNELPVVDNDEITLDDPILFMDVVDGTGLVGQPVGHVGLVDPEGDVLTYTYVSTGTGDPYFSIDSSGNIILEAALPDDWDPTEISRQYTLVFDLADNNSEGLPNGIQTASNITLTIVVSKNQPPVFVSPVQTEFTISENVEGSISDGDDLSPVLVIEATDPENDPITYSVEPNAGFNEQALADLFEVVEVDGEFRLVVADAENLRFNFVNSLGAVNGTFSVDLIAFDGFSETRMTIEITVLDENDRPEFEAPAPGSITVEELVQHFDDANNNIQPGQVVYDLTNAFSDPDVNDTLTFSIVATFATGDEQLDLSGAFAISGNNLVIADPTLIDYEALAEGSITVTILADDGNALPNSTVTGNIVIDVLDQNELPTVDEPIDPINLLLADLEDFTDPVVVGNISDVLTLVDPEGHAILYLQQTVGASGEGIFQLNSNGQIVQIAAVDLDGDLSRDFELVFFIEDSEGLSSDDLGFPGFTLTITVTDNLPPVITSPNAFSLNENLANGAEVFTVVANDPEGDLPLVYSLVDATGIFTINSETGVITILNNTNLDFATLPNFNITVTVADSLGNETEQDIAVTVLEVVSEPPVLNEGAEVDPIFVNEGDVVWDGVNDFYTLSFSNADYNFRGQFTDPEDDPLTLFIANLAELEAKDYIISAEYDDVADALVITFAHYAASQDRSGVVVEIGANDGTSNSAENLMVDLSVNAEEVVDFRLIPVLMPTSGSGLSVSEANLPAGVERLADEQTFIVEIWVKANYGVNDAATGRTYADGLSALDLNLQFENDLVTVVNVMTNPQISTIPTDGPVFDNDAGGIGRNFVAESFAGFYVEGFGGQKIGANGNFTRFAMIELTIKSGVDTSGLVSLDDLIRFDFSGTSEFSLQPVEGDLAGESSLLQSLNQSQVTITRPDIEVIDAVKFSIDLSQSQVVIPVGPTGGKINGAEVTGQGGSGVGNVAAISGDIYIVFEGTDPNNPTSIQIIGMDLILENGGNYKAGAPNTEGGDPVTGASPGNLGLVSSVGGAGGVQNVNMAFRETVIRLTGDAAFTLTGDATAGGASFDASELNLGIGNGFADTNLVSSDFDVVLQRNSVAGQPLAVAGTESALLVGDGSGGFTLTLGLLRQIFGESIIVGDYTLDLDLLFDATIVAELNGGAAPLMGTSTGNSNQPLESGSGVFLTVVKNPTQVDPNNQLTELPDSLKWTDEWGSVWVEVWGNTADAAGIYGGYVDIAYNSDVYTATQFQYASNFDLERAGSVDDAAGMIYGLGSRSETFDQGNGGFVLLGRVKLESLEGDGIQVGVDKDFKPESLGLEVVSAQLDYTGVGTLSTPVAHVPNVEVWGVAYDINNDGRIGLSDFTKFISAYGASTLTSDNPLASAFDFNNDGKVGLADFTFFIQNYGKTKGGGREVIFPSNFAQTWVGQQIQLDGPDSLQQVFDAALQDWHEALGWDHVIDVQLVVKDLPGSQLGEAQLVQLDANGLPAKGIVTIDNDGAGLGWSSDLVGGPAEGQYDLYTVILHELGHVFGFMQQYSGFGANIVTDAFGDKVYYGPNFTAKLDAAGQHLDEVDHAGDVMNATLDPGVRKTISDLNVQILLAAYDNASGATFNSSTAALHAMSVPTVGNGESEAISATTSAATVTSSAPNATEFVMGEIAELTAVSGRTGTAVVMPEMLSSKLQQNGLRVHTRSTFQSVNLRDDIDSAVAELDFSEVSGLLGMTEDSAEFEVARTADADDDLDDLFATWGEDQI